MKQFLKNITSVILAFLVLFSTFSFTVEKHYCGDFLVDVSYTGDAKECNMDNGTSNVVQMKKCCKNEVEQVKGQDELQQNSIHKITFKDQQFIISFVIAYVDLLSNSEQDRSLFEYQSPPPNLDRDYQVFYQSFLI
ncbi:MULTISPECIES: HYC_CC_PP family protein [Tenacibaculum]|uniref:HYC_CC_PP family protein n=1 Tax=Tenacibaculum TaxID=104267 RepID=UPI001F0A56C9|nr:MULTISPECIES: hypothetical protein [Tenacibaculum]MCH3881925.1 hypothetical protein [Tenacibaculum aquimarinum]MCH3885836.1 hypothetical protein [Tenacibaculum aquimarinum]MDO6598505.1 hypothetical protein [Tenacibaculum sp. 1_MG-2023]